MDTGEIWYGMQSAVSHLEEQERKEALETALGNLLTRWEEEFGEHW